VGPGGAGRDQIGWDTAGGPGWDIEGLSGAERAEWGWEGL